MADEDKAREAALAAILPAGVDRYIALFDGDPRDTGVEISPAGYARVNHTTWSSISLGDLSRRSNVGAVTFPTMTENARCSHWGVYTAAVGGELWRVEVILNGVGEPFPIEIIAPDDVEFANDALGIFFEETAP